MATIVNRRRGTTAQHAAFTGAIAETTYDSDKKTLVAHDAVTPGGFPVAAPHLSNPWADGVKQTFNPSGTNAGANVGANAVDPSALVNGDIWYQSTANELRARINGATVALGDPTTLAYRATAVTTTFLASDYTIYATSGTFTINLPTAVGIGGRIYVAKNSGVGTITLDPAGAELIDGLATATIVSGAALQVQSIGVGGWIII